MKVESILPKGHADLSSFWVGAGHLKVGDEVKTLGGTGLVRKAVTLEKPQVMYNLTVDKAHTFFVGDGQWLVHNCPDLDDTTISNKYSIYSRRMAKGF